MTNTTSALDALTSSSHILRDMFKRQKKKKPTVIQLSTTLGKIHAL